MTTAKDAFPPIIDEDDGIRLLELQRDLPPQSGEIRGALKYVRLSDNPDYVAMSYTWGSAPPTKSIVLADDVHIRISESLFHGLIAVSDEGYLWVDQICINQQDEHEKASQVKAMSKIYHQAREVVAWLGLEGKNTELAFRHLRFLGRDDSEGSYITRDVEDAFRQGRAGDLFSPLSRGGKAMAALTRNRWFSRLWVVQEVVLASKLRLQCGRHYITGDAFFRAIDTTCSIITSPPQPGILEPFLKAYKISQLRKRIARAEIPSYPYLAHSLVGWGCQNDCDRLNALFGIVSRGNEVAGAWFSPNYTKRVEELYEDFAQAFFQQCNDLTLLHFSGIGIGGRGTATPQEDGTCTHFIEPPEYLLPQWVPDWRVCPRPLPLSPEFCHLRPATAFCASLAAPKYTLHTNLQLQVRAIQVDTVVECGPSWQPENAFVLPPGNEPTDLPILEKWYALAKRLDARNPNFEADFASTLVMGGEVSTTESETKGFHDTDCFHTIFQQWRALQACTHEEARQSEAERQPTDLDARVAQYASHVRELCRIRRFFVTRDGRMGLGSIQVEPKADVFIIHGLRTPFVVDRADPRCHILRGDCYVHGLMNCGMQESDKDEDLYLS